MRTTALRVRTIDDRRVAVVGELDASSVHVLRAALVPILAKRGDVVVDLAALRFADTSGVRCLVEAAWALDGDLILVAPQQAVDRVFDLMSIERSRPNIHVLPAGSAEAGRATGRPRCACCGGGLLRTAELPEYDDPEIGPLMLSDAWFCSTCSQLLKAAFVRSWSDAEPGSWICPRHRPRNAFPGPSPRVIALPLVAERWDDVPLSVVEGGEVGDAGPRPGGA